MPDPTEDTGAYREAFIREARASLEAMNAALLEAERSDPLKEALRAVHTFKGMAGMMRLEGAAGLCHGLEDALAAARQGRLDVSKRADLFFESFDRLAEAVRALEGGAPEPDCASAVEALRSAAAGLPGPGSGPPGPAPGAAPEPGGPAAGPIGPLERIGQLPVRVEILDRLMNLIEELLIAKMRFEPLRGSLTRPELSAAVGTLGRTVAELQYQVTKARMMPLRLVIGRFQRLVRDLARQQGKDVALVQEGGDLELDRTMQDEVGEALLHLLRNAVDHGIEPPGERVAKGKPPQGTIRVAAARTAESAVLSVSDDGAGLDLEAIRRAGESRGTLRQGASREELMKAVLSGLSTRKEATAISGRGLGLEIVGRKMRALGGALSVSSEPGKGASIRMEVPLTLAILKALLVEVGGGTYAVPLAEVGRIISVSESQVRRALGQESVVRGAQDIPLLRLRALFGLPPGGQARFPVVVLGSGERALGLAVDALVATQELVLKPLSRVLREGGPFAGSAIVGAGEAILVLDVAGLMRERRLAVSA